MILGLYTLKSRRDSDRLVQWGKFVLMKDTRLVKFIYQFRRYSFTVFGTKNWCFYTHHLLVDLGLIQVWEDSSINSLSSWKKRVLEAVQQRDVRLWHEERQQKSKL